MKNFVIYLGVGVYFVMTLAYTFLYFTGVKTIQVSNWVETRTVNTFPMMVIMWSVIVLTLLVVTLPFKFRRKLF